MSEVKTSFGVDAAVASPETMADASPRQHPNESYGSAARSALSCIIDPGHSGSLGSQLLPKDMDASIIADAHTARKTGWLATAALIIADIVGTGVLSLPGAFASLGMAAGVISLIVCYPLNFFTGYQLNKVHLKFSSAVTFGDAGYHFFGTIGGVIMYGSLYLYLLLLLGDYFITLSKSIQSIFWSSDLCRPVAGVITAALLIPTNQFRTLGGLTYLSIMSFGTVLVVLVIYLWTILALPGGQECVPQTIAPLGTGASAVLNVAHAISKFIFAFSGQKIFLEMQAEMVEPELFVRSMHVALPVLAAVFMIIAVVSLQVCGDHTPGYILDALEYNWTRTFANVLMFAHLVVSYTISQQVLARAIAIRVFPMALGTGTSGRLTWFTLTTVQMFFGWTMANLIPLFGDFVGLMGALLSTQMSFTFPTVLYLGARHHYGQLMPGALDQVMIVLSVVCLVVAAFFTVVGTISAVQNIAADAASGVGTPFGCHCISKACQVDVDGIF